MRPRPPCTRPLCARLTVTDMTAAAGDLTQHRRNRAPVRKLRLCAPLFDLTGNGMASRLAARTQAHGDPSAPTAAIWRPPGNGMETPAESECTYARENAH